MKVLIIDDEQFIADSLKQSLATQGIDAVTVVDSHYIEAGKKACSVLRQIHHADDAFHALILDIHFQDHFIGGLKIYSKILTEGLRGRFRHLIISTKYFPTGGVKGDAFRAIEIFRELSFAPPQNVLPKDSKTHNKIAERLRELIKEVNTPIGTYGMWHFH